MLAGGLDQEVTKIICGGRLISLKKKDEGLRPIAIGYTLRRLAAKCANKYATAKLASYFAPIQLGVGTPGGAEAAAIHAVRRYAENLPKNYIVIQLDFKNAFNTLRNHTLLDAIRSVPGAVQRHPCNIQRSKSPAIRRVHHPLCRRTTARRSIEFGRVLSGNTPLLRGLISEIKVGYLDDVTLSGPAPESCRRHQDNQLQVRRAALDLDAAKCKVTYGDTSTPHDDPYFEDLPAHWNGGAHTVGSTDPSRTSHG